MKMDKTQNLNNAATTLFYERVSVSVSMSE
jgi:hypothetical protein